MDVPVRRSWVLWALLALVAATLSVAGTAPPSNAADGDQRVVSSPGSDYWDSAGQWTPDSTSLLIQRAHRDGRYEFITQRIDQTRGRSLITFDPEADFWQPRMSPDGRRIIYTMQTFDWVSTMHILNLNDMSDQVVPVPPPATVVRDAEWSPDGKRILFTAQMPYPGARELFVANSDGTSAHALTDATDARCGGQAVDEPRWSPDGAAIAFLSLACGEQTYRIHLVDAGGGSPQALNLTVDDFGWSPDSRHFVVSRKVGALNQLAVTDLTGTVVKTLPSAFNDRGPAWSPDGRFIAFYRSSPGGTSRGVWVRSLGAAIPEAWDVPVGVSINQAALFTNSREVSVLVSPPMNATTVTLSNDGGFAKSRTFRVNQLQQQIPWTLNTPVASVLPSIVYARFTADGPHYTDDIVLDVTVPVIDGAEVAPAVSPTTTRMAGTSRLTVRARDNRSGVGAIQLNSAPTPAGAVTVPYAPTRLVKGWSATSWVRVRDRAGNWSRWRLARPIPTRPTSVRWANAATTAPGTATLRWAPPVNLGFPSTVSYRVRRTGPNGSLYGPELRTTNTTVAFAGLRAGATYRVQIVAVNPTGRSAPVTVLARPTK